ncbi:MAG: dihydrodipicolinate synthase family protein [Acidimicrobiales bacterium]
MIDRQLHGILAAIVTPFTPEDRLDVEALRAYLGWLRDQRVHAVVVHADSGEGPALTPEERATVTGIAADVLGEHLPVVAGLIGQSTAEAVRLAKMDRDAGADALMIFPPTSFLGTPLPAEVPESYYAAIGEGSGLPLVAFQLQSALGGVEYPPEALLRILAVDHVVAIKESTFDALKFRTTMRLVRQHHPDVAYLSGNDNFIFESLLLGADGCLIGFGTLACTEQVEIYEALKIRDVERAEKVYRTIEPLIDAVFAPPLRNYRARMKHALVLQGVLPNDHVRLPLPELTDEERTAVRDGLAHAGLLERARR